MPVPAPTVIYQGFVDLTSQTSFTVNTTAAIPANGRVQWNVALNDGSYVSSISDTLGTTYTADTYGANPYLGTLSRTVTFTALFGGTGLSSGSTITFNLTFGPSSTDAWVIGVLLVDGATDDATGDNGLTGTSGGPSFTVFDNTTDAPSASGQTLMAVTTNGTGAGTTVPDPPWTLVATGQSDANYGMKLYAADTTTSGFTTAATRTGASNEYTSVWHAYDYTVASPAISSTLLTLGVG